MTIPTRPDFRFFDRLRVRWAEVDMQRIVFNGHYLMYFDTAVAGYWRAMAMPYHETVDSLGGDLFVRKATVEYLGSARYDDRCDVGVRCARIGNSSMVMAAAVFRGETLLVHGELVYVWADPATQTSRAVPAALREVMQGFEAGEAMVELRSGSLGDLGEFASGVQRLRREAAGAHAATEAATEAAADEALDAGAHHALLVNRFGVPVASGRLLRESRGVGRIDGMVVHPALRGSGFGRRLLDVLVDAARARGDHELVLHAEPAVQGFCARAGFGPRGEAPATSGAPRPMALALGRAA